RAARPRDAEERIPADGEGPWDLKSPWLAGVPAKAGALNYGDTRADAETAAETILKLEIKGQMPRGVLIEQRAPVAQEYFAAVTWDGRRKLPVLIFSDMGGIDIEEVAEKHPEHVARVHLSTILPWSAYRAKEAIAA